MNKLLLAFLLASLFATPAQAFGPVGNPVASVQTAAAAGSLILKASPGWLTGLSVTSSGSTSGYVLVFDSATVPADGASQIPKFCYYLSAPNTIAASWLQYPVPFANGISVVFSTTGCYTKTISNTSIFISGQVQ